MKSNGNICEHLEDNKMAGNYGFEFDMSLQSSLVLSVNDQEVWAEE